ncbi:uncharacterized protein [Rutidosis leptorrhynchoides]|uniref:uncharacterized protein n=1 Tax=Rutidosis leptorrhynchoides TaxID=125765 RepID=UPI003A99346F
MSTPLNIPLKDIESITNKFSEANFIGKGFLGKIYQGQLSVSGELIDVAVRRLDHSFWLQDIAFEKEISILSSLKHENLVSNVGLCKENHEMIIINKREPRGSLKMHLSDPRLTWMKRLKISVGVASVLSYLHNLKPKSVVHHNVNSYSILLDEKWEAKLSGFEYSMIIPPARDLDLTYEKLGIGTYKSDVFSFGIVLFEILCREKAFAGNDDDGSFKTSLAIFQYENRKLHKFVDPDLLRQMDQQSFNILSKTAYDCLKEPRSPPNMKDVLKRLKRALEYQHKHESPERSTIALERPLPNHLILKVKNMEHMRIQLKDILLATENFSSGRLILSGGYGGVYKGKLHHVDRRYLYDIEGENECDVAIKRISDPEDEIAKEGFYAEIEMLTKCKDSNIITLLGFCDEGSSMILVYEYAPNKSLADYIRKESSIHNLSFAKRIKICLDVAKGLNCLHTKDGDRHEIVHRDIKSDNILLGKNLDAKIGDFGLSTFVSVSKELNPLYYTINAGTKAYMDPQYAKEKKLKIEIDVYSFGVVLFEILFGKLAYDPIFSSRNNKGLAVVACQHFESGTLIEMVDPKIKQETIETIFASVIGPNQDSVNTFSQIAFQCLNESQNHRPTMKVVIKELQKALLFQENRKDIFRAPLDVIKLATNNFSDSQCIEKEGFWNTYRGEISHASSGHTIICDVKRLDTSRLETEDAFPTELKILLEHKHENIISLLGYCDEKDEKIIVYEHASSGSLNKYLNDGSVTWAKRLEISIDIARGLEFLHEGIVADEIVIHRDIKSGNIRLDGDMKAKIAGFGLSIIRLTNQKKVFLTDYVSGTKFYIDPDYFKKGLLSKECDIYSFGVVLFEIMLRKFAYSDEMLDHIGPTLKGLYKKGKLDEMVVEGTTEQISPESLTIFKRIAIQCLHDIREERPTASELVIQLKKALEIQEKGMDIIKISFEDIKSATDNFNEKRCIGKGGFGKVYKGILPHANGQNIIVAAKRLQRNGTSGQGDPEFHQELEILFKFKHKNIINLEGYCDEMDEKIVVYEYASKESLDKWLNNKSLTWLKRLAICIDIASGLDFLHGGFSRQEAVIHRDIKSSNVLLSEDWKAKITDFGLSIITPMNQTIDDIINDPVGTCGYLDPVYLKTEILTKKSDIYSFGVVLFDILCGKLAWTYNMNQLLISLVKHNFEESKLDDIVFEGIKGKIGPQSFDTFSRIAYRCLDLDREKRPTASQVLVQLKKALDFQEDFEFWEPKLPVDYKRIVRLSQNPEINLKKMKIDLYHMFCEGILLRGGKLFLTLDNNGRINEMIPARTFSDKDQRWKNAKLNPKSRFHRVAIMSDISKLMIDIKIKTQFLSPKVAYGVHLIFKFGDLKKLTSDIMYVNLKYKKGNETMHAYFAEQRDDEWMMIELFRFFNLEKVTDFKVLLESFSRYYCGNGVIYVEGIEFRSIDDVKQEGDKLKELEQVSSSNSNMGQEQQLPTEAEREREISENSEEGEKLLSEVDGKKHYMFSAEDVLYDSSNVKLFMFKTSEHPRFRKVIELRAQQVIRLKCKIESQMLSPNTDYTCYLVFKLSEKCRGLQCPVKVRNLLQRNNKEIEFLYFRSPTPWNLHDIIHVPKQREDEWMEVVVWKFNSNLDHKNGFVPINLKLISYEGMMAGLVVLGIEFRPM